MSASSFLILKNTELWDYQYTRLLISNVSGCQLACASSPFCAGYKYYPSTYSNAIYRNKCSLFYWINEATGTKMLGVNSAIRINAPIRDKNCYENFVLSDIGCNIDSPKVAYPKIEEAIQQCTLDSICSAVEVDASFSTISKLPTGTEPGCIAFAQNNLGIQVSYFTKDGDTSRCKKECGLGNNHLVQCDGTEPAPSNPVPKDPSQHGEVDYNSIIIIVPIVLGLVLLVIFIIFRIQRVRRGLKKVQNIEVKSPGLEHSYRNRSPYEFNQDPVIK
eukprot:NODE_457_length_8231_cov_0.314068.p4 type:complete len:275 gc:universal NODE_457_length_8231_cov_0.314068:2150-1326(-)